MFFCAISGSPPVAPVVSRTSGTVYERALIERYIEENGTDPISGEALTRDDLIDVKAKPSTLPPRPSNQTSIPSLLTSLQSEFDSIMLESLEIKKAFQSSRQELANALYREDAATRVIARLMKERDEARDALASIQKTVGFAPAATGVVEAEGEGQGDGEGDVDMRPEGSLPKEVEEKINETNAALSATRRKRKPAPGYAKSDAISSYTQISHVPSLHATKPAGITSLDVASDGNIIATGGADKIVQIFDLEASKVLGSLKGHTKAVKHVAFREAEGSPRVVISGSDDKTVRIWSEDSQSGKWSAQATMTGHKSEITGLGVHPSGAYVAAGSLDSTWSLYDIAEGKSIATYGALQGMEGSFAYTSFSVHPDGVLHGGGTKDRLIRVWDARQSGSLAATVASHSSSSSGAGVSTISFSENGYYLAAGGESTVNIIDLRKLTVLSTWNLPAENTISEVRFDPSAQFLSVAGTDLRVYANKTWDEVLKFEDNAGVLTGARFAQEGGKVVLGGMDRSIRVLGKKAE